MCSTSVLPSFVVSRGRRFLSIALLAVHLVAQLTAADSAVRRTPSTAAVLSVSSAAAGLASRGGLLDGTSGQESATLVISGQHDDRQRASMTSGFVENSRTSASEEQRRRRSAEDVDGDDDVDDDVINNDRMLSASRMRLRRGRWSKNNLQIWGKRSATVGNGDDQDSRGNNVDDMNDDSDVNRKLMQSNNNNNNDDDDLDEGEQSRDQKPVWSKNNVSVWRKKAALRRRRRLDDGGDHFRYATGNPVERTESTIGDDDARHAPTVDDVGWDPSTDGGEMYADGGEETVPGVVRGLQGVPKLTRPPLAKRSAASNHQSLLGDLLLKRLAAGKDQLGAWNGGQKGWASNNVRIWG